VSLLVAASMQGMLPVEWEQQVAFKEAPTMQVVTMQEIMQVEWAVVDWDQVLLLQVEDLVLLLAVEVCMLVVADMQLVRDWVPGVALPSRQTLDVELDQDQLTRDVA